MATALLTTLRCVQVCWQHVGHTIRKSVSKHKHHLIVLLPRHRHMVFTRERPASQAPLQFNLVFLFLSTWVVVEAEAP